MISLPILIEFIIYLIWSTMAKPSKKYKELISSKNVITSELKEIKSLQLEFVRHSLLSRRIIKIDKEIDESKGK